MKILTSLYLIFVFSSLLVAQPISDLKRDYVWLTGYDSNPNNLKYGGTRFDFSTNPPTIVYEYREMDLEATNSVICDEVGQLLFYTNNSYIANYKNEMIENGDGLNPELSLPQDRESQSTLLLPVPDNSNLFYLFHEEVTYVGDLDGNIAAVLTIYHTKVDMSMNDGEGKVIEKNIPLIQDTLDFGKITATRHANGRDWWLLVPEYSSNKFYTFLISPQGIQEYPIQVVGQKMVSGVGQAVFSPDGNKYVRFNSVSASIGAFLDIYDFDRCTGTLSNQRRLLSNINPGTGVAISPNSRYLYVAFVRKVFQYDLLAENIEESEVLVACFDGYFSAPFYVMQLAPDNKIYIAVYSSMNVMNVIHHPDSSGVACSLEQHALQLPTINNGTIPNNPNFRLGALEGSSCDTLFAEYPPYADFTYFIEDNSVIFQDRSLYSPDEWFWDFGDMTTSDETNPTHHYEATGNYSISLTVTNQYGSSTYTDTVSFIVNDVGETTVANRFLIFPNPVTDYLNIRFSEPIRTKTILMITDNLGKVVLHSALFKGFQNHKLALYNLPAGIYYYRMTTQAGVIGAGKLIKQ